MLNYPWLLMCGAGHSRQRQTPNGDSPGANLQALHAIFAKWRSHPMAVPPVYPVCKNNRLYTTRLNDVLHLSMGVTIKWSHDNFVYLAHDSDGLLFRPPGTRPRPSFRAPVVWCFCPKQTKPGSFQRQSIGSANGQPEIVHRCTKRREV